MKPDALLSFFMRKRQRVLALSMAGIILRVFHSEHIVPVMQPRQEIQGIHPMESC